MKEQALTFKQAAILANLALLLCLAPQSLCQTPAAADEDSLRAQVLQYEQKPGREGDEQLATARLKLATFLKEKNNLGAARELTLLALAAQELLFGEGNVKSVPALMLLIRLRSEDKLDGRIYTKLENALSELANQERKQAVKYRVELAKIYIDTSQEQEAKRLWYQCTDLLRDHLAADCKDLAAQCKEVFARLSRENQWTEGQSLAEMMAQYGFEQDVLVSAANGFVVISQTQENFGEYKKAYKLALRGLKIADKYGGKQNCSYVGALRQSADLLRKLGKADKAAKQEREVERLLEKPLH